MRKIKTVFLNLLLLMVLFFILMLFLFFFNISAYNYLEKSKKKLIADFKDLTGFELSYEKLSPNIIGNIKVYQVKIDDHEGTSLMLGDIDLNYSILSFLKNKSNPLNLITKVTLKTFRFQSGKNELSKIISRFKKKFATTSNNKRDKYDIIPKNLIFEIRDGRISLEDNGSSIELDLLNFRVSFDKFIKINSILNLDLNYSKNLKVQSSLKLSGEIRDIADLSTSFNLDFKTLNINQFKLKRQTFVFENRGFNVKLSRIKDTLPLSLSVEKNENILDVNLRIDNFNIKNFFVDKIDIPNVPDNIFLNTVLKLNLDNKAIEGKMAATLFYKKLYSFDNLKIVTNLGVLRNRVNINTLRVEHQTKDSFVDISGSIPLDLSDFDISLKFKDFIIYGQNLNSSVNLAKKKNNISVISDFLLLNGNDIGNLDLLIEVLNKNLFNIKSVTSFNGYSFNGKIFFTKNVFNLNLENNFDNFNLTRLIRAFSKDFKKQFLLSGKSNLNISNGKIELEQTPFIITGDNTQIASFKINIRDKIISCSELYINKYNINGSGELDFKKVPLDVSFNIKNDLYNFDINSKIFKDSILVKLNDQLESTINLKKHLIEVNAQDFLIPIKGNNININMNFVFDLNNKNIAENSIRIDNVPLFRNEIGNITTKMKYENNNLSFDEFTYRDSENEITGNLNSELIKDEKLTITGKGFFKDVNKGESYSLDYKLINNEIESKIYVSHMDMRKILANTINGFINVRFFLSGDIKNPNIDFDGDISEAKLGKSSLSGYFFAKKSESKLLLKRIFLQLGQNRLSLKDSDITFGKDKSKILNINGSLYIESLSKIFKSDIQIKGVYNDLAPDVDLILDKMNLGILKKSQLTKLEKFDQVKFNLSKNNNILVFKNYGKKFIYFTKENNNINLKLYNKDASVFDFNITSDNSNLNGKIVFNKFPVNAIYRILYPYVGLEDGLIDGVYEIRGTNKNPELYGKANLYYGVVDLPQYLQEKIVNISGIIVADKNRFLVNNVNGQVRRGNAHGYGEVVFNGIKFERYLFKLTSDIVPALINAGPVDARGMGKVENFTIEGRDGVFNFIADLMIDDAEVNLSGLMGAGGEKSSEPPKTLPINVLINFKAGKKVNVNYPLVKGTIKPNDVFILKYIGSEPNIYLGGTVNLNKGEIYYLNKTFKVEQASFSFDENTTSINPIVNIKSSSRVKDANGESVKLTLTFLDKLLSFKTEFSAFPYKTQDEIQSLLGITASSINTKNEITGNETSNLQNFDAIINTANYLSNSFLFSSIENSVKRSTGLDTFNFNTGFLGNILKSSTNLLDVLDDSSLSVGKYLSDQIYLGSTMTFNKRDSASDKFFLPLQDDKYGLNMQFMLQVELPYLSLGYSFQPLDLTNFLNSEHKVSIETSFKF